jgi:PhoPQ-activated pathogenicity-related protein
MIWALVALCAFAGVVSGTPLDDYLNKVEPDYKYFDTGKRVKTLLGGTGFVLNVTSQRWLDTSKAVGPNGDIWTHMVVAIVPDELRITNVSMAYLTGSCNEHPSVPKWSDEELLVADMLSKQNGMIASVVYQLPNCHIVYPSDPSHKAREEDAMIAWAWNEYLKDPKHNPEWLPRLPMAKGAMQSMRAVTEFMAAEKIAEIEGWFVAGASKRGWTTWMVGSATCEKCVKIVGIAPLVPIVPNLVKEMHRQWMAYGGWTFAFSDYTAVNLTVNVDNPVFEEAMKIVDPAYYGDRLARLPKAVVLSSDDEFMMMDWSNIWYDDLTGESHLLIVPNSEHSLASGIPELLETLTNFIGSIALGHTTRPSFDYKYDSTTGEITVTVDPSFENTKVVLRFGETLQNVRRDFRWVRQANNYTQKCDFPFIPLKKPLFGGNCLQPIIWLGKTLKAEPGQPNTFVAKAPEPAPGFWMGYYVEIFSKSDVGFTDDYQFTTPGYTWPNTLPFPDCHEETCIPRIV